MSETEKPVEVSYKVDYADPETTDDTEFTEILGVGGTSTSWSLEINTATAFVRTGRPNPTKDDKITLKVEVTDTAQNVGSAEIEVYVDQDTDRPIINLSNLDDDIEGMTSSKPVWHKQKYLFGSVTDDDGTVKVYKFDYLNGKIPDVVQPLAGHSVGDMVMLNGYECIIEDVSL